MRRFMVAAALSVMLCGTAEAGVGDIFKNVGTYLFGFVTCAVERGGKLVEWLVDSGTCAIRTANKNPTTLDPLVTGVPHDGGTE